MSRWISDELWKEGRQEGREGGKGGKKKKEGMYSAQKCKTTTRI